jgi:hypothetical protein
MSEYENTEITYIYVLVDPRDNSIRYVGKTSNPKYRLSGHITECKKESVVHYRARWIKTLLKENLKPEIKFIKVCPLEGFEEIESYYIKMYKSYKLTNSDESGQGNKNRIKEVIDRQSKSSGRVVYQYDLDGNFLKEFRSARTAASELNLNHGNISRCCNDKFKHAGGYIFRYEKNEVIDKVLNPNAVQKKVIEIDYNGETIGEWSSIMECSRSTGIDNSHISRICNGINKSHKKRRFRFT